MEHTVMKHRRTTLERTEHYISPTYFTDVNLRGRLYPNRAPITSLTHFAAPGRIPYEDAIQSKFEPVQIGDSFGPLWSTHWFCVAADIPVSWVGKGVCLVWNSNSEAMVWKDGEPLQGLSSEHDKFYYVLCKIAEEEDLSHTLYIEMACNGLFGAGHNGLINPPDSKKTFTLSKAEIAVFDPIVHGLIVDLEVLIGMAKHLPDGSERGFQALYTANRVVNECAKQDPISYHRARGIAQKFFSQKNGESQHVIHAVGHCHIDSAWLWPYAETIRKCARSWSGVVHLMDQYPHFTFACSQAQQFEWVKSHYPSLYSKMKDFIKRGQFIPIGGTWVEMDGNIPSGESFVRQFLYGQRFFKEEFDMICTEFWLPDTFGYSAQLPQIMAMFGITRFVTQKLSWNLMNKFPHHTFWWQGIDGSQVLTHFPPGDSYEMTGAVEEVLRTVRNFQDKGRSGQSLYLFGHGDGGNGPTEVMLERLDRIHDVDGLPRVKMSTPDEYFKVVEDEDADKLCRWKGELYLELHNGTYTTYAKMKQLNRKCEFLLHDVELTNTIGLVVSLSRGVPYSYPSSQLLHLWKLLLLNQFHDVLPGTSINLVYEDALQYYEEIEESGKTLLKQGITAMFNGKEQSEEMNVVINSQCWDRTEVVTLPATGDDAVAPLKYLTSPLDIIQTDCHGNTLLMMQVPACGYSLLKPLTPKKIVTAQKLDDLIILENEQLSAILDKQGRLVRLHVANDRRNGIQAGCHGNQFVIFDDVPLYWDAWDVMDYHLETRKPVEDILQTASVVDEGPLRAALEFSLKISENSSIRQMVSLDAGSPYLLFQTEVVWHESHKFLKVEFPWNISTSHASYEIQYGSIQRSTHSNTSWDWAQFEVCGHKWADLSEYDFGVALLNDCKYGYSAFDSVLRLSLLRAPKAPDPQADMMTHHFTYAVMPHTGSFQDSGVIQQAYNLNSALSVHHTDMAFIGPHQSFSYFSVSTREVVLETVKKSEDQSRSIVLRLYEAFGGHVTARITLGFSFKKASKCNGLEQPLENDKGKLQVIDSTSFLLDFTPFQIITVLVEV